MIRTARLACILAIFTVVGRSCRASSRHSKRVYLRSGEVLEAIVLEIEKCRWTKESRAKGGSGSAGRYVRRSPESACLRA